MGIRSHTNVLTARIFLEDTKAACKLPNVDCHYKQKKKEWNENDLNEYFLPVHCFCCQHYIPPTDYRKSVVFTYFYFLQGQKLELSRQLQISYNYKFLMHLYLLQIHRNHTRKTVSSILLYIRQTISGIKMK